MFNVGSQGGGWGVLGPGFGFEIGGKPMCCAQIRLSGSQVSHTVIDHVCLYVCSSVLSTLTHTEAVWVQAAYTISHNPTHPSGASRSRVTFRLRSCFLSRRLPWIQAQTCKYKPRPANTNQTWNTCPGLQIQPRHANTSQELQIQARLANTSQTCKYKPRPANTNQDLEIPARRTNTCPDMQIQAQTCKYKPRLTNTSHTCKYMPRLANTSPDLQIQAQTSNTSKICKYMPGHANASPDLQMQAPSCKYKPDLQIHAQTYKYKPRPTNTSPDLQIQAQTYTSAIQQANHGVGRSLHPLIHTVTE